MTERTGLPCRVSALASLVPAALKEKPSALLGFVDPVLQQACGGHVPCLVTKRMYLAHVPRQHRIVVAELGYHVEWFNVFSIVVCDALETRDLPDRVKGCAADLPRSFGNGIRHGENLLALVIEHQMIVPEVWTRHMPMEILGFEIQRKHVREEQHQCSRNVMNRFFRKIRRSRERRSLQHGVTSLIGG